jgi:glycosyltransferase involved in cell wall biosynthesis
VIAISIAVKEFMIENKEIMPETFVKVIPYGYKRLSKAKRQHQFVAEGAVNNHIVRFGTLSRLTYQKNIPFMLEFASELRKKDFDFRLEIAGQGPHRKAIEKLIKQKRLEESVFLLGKLVKPMNFLQSLDYFLLTSRYEGFGLALLEAMDAEIPILAPNNSSIPEVLGLDHLGLFDYNVIDLVERFFSIHENARTKKALVDFQLRRLRKFDVLLYFKRHEEVYNRIKRVGC